MSTGCLVPTSCGTYRHPGCRRMSGVSVTNSRQLQDVLDNKERRRVLQKLTRIGGVQRYKDELRQALADTEGVVSLILYGSQGVCSFIHATFKIYGPPTPFCWSLTTRKEYASGTSTVTSILISGWGRRPCCWAMPIRWVTLTSQGFPGATASGRDAGMPHGRFPGLRSGRAGATMPFDCPIRRGHRVGLGF